MKGFRTKSLSNPPSHDDGTRVLITRYRPRGVRRGQESWDAWEQRLAPTTELLDAWYGKKRVGRSVVHRDLPPIPWDEFAVRFCEQMKSPAARTAIQEWRRRSESGEAITLLCHCSDPARCHRSLVKRLLTS